MVFNLNWDGGEPQGYPLFLKHHAWKILTWNFVLQVIFLIKRSYSRQKMIRDVGSHAGSRRTRESRTSMSTNVDSLVNDCHMVTRRTSNKWHKRRRKRRHLRQNCQPVLITALWTFKTIETISHSQWLCSRDKCDFFFFF